MFLLLWHHMGSAMRRETDKPAFDNINLFIMLN